MNTLFIHIGLPKTGTKSLQSTLHKCCDDLAKHNIYYPTDPITKHNTKWTHDGFLFNFTDVLPILSNKLGTDDVIISSESISGWTTRVPEEDVLKQLEALNTLNSKIVFVISVRNFDKWVTSYIIQNMRILGIQNTNEEFWVRILSRYIRSVNRLFDILKGIFILKGINIPTYLINSDSNNPKKLIENFQNVLITTTNKNIDNILVDHFNEVGTLNVTSETDFFDYIFFSYIRKLYMQKHNSYPYGRETISFIDQFREMCEFKNNEYLNNIFVEYLNDFVFKIKDILIADHSESILIFKQNLNIN